MVDCFVVDLRIPNIADHLFKLMLLNYTWINSIVIIVNTTETDNVEGYENITQIDIKTQDDLNILKNSLISSEISTGDIVCGAFLGVVQIVEERGEIKKKLVSNKSNLVILNNNEFTFSNDSEKDQFLDQCNQENIEVNYFQTTPRTIKVPFQVKLVDPYFSKSPRAISQYSGMFTLSPNCEFLVKVFTKTTRTQGPTLHSKYQDTEQVNDSMDIDNDVETSNKESVPLQEPTVKKAFKYANELEVLDGEDWDYLNAIERTDRGIEYLGSINESEFRTETCLSPAKFVFAEPKSQVPYQAFLQSLIKNKKYAIVREQLRANSHQRVSVLIPCYDEGYYGLLQQLPYHQDVRNYPFPTLPVANNKSNPDAWKSAKPSKRTLDAIHKIINESASDELDPNQLHLINWHYMFQISLQRVMGKNPDFKLPEYLSKELEPSPELVAIVNKYINDIPEDDTPVKIVKKTAAKDIKEGEDIADLGDFLKLVNIGPVEDKVVISEDNYIQEFQDALDNEDTITKGVEAMILFIEEEMKIEDKDEIVSDAIARLREVCPSENESGTFNQWLIGLKQQGGDAYEYMKYQQILPISNVEARDSKLTEEYCNKFYS